MTEISKQVLNEYFSNFKEYHLIILCFFTVIIALIQIIQSIYISRKIEKYKNILKKSEIKFSRYNELQVVALRTIYHLTVELHKRNRILLDDSTTELGLNQFTVRINNWLKAYNECNSEFSKEKILLPSSLKKQYSQVLNDFEKIRITLIKEQKSLADEEHAQANGYGYQYAEEEHEGILKQLKTLKTENHFINSENHISDLRESIEVYFSGIE